VTGLSRPHEIEMRPEVVIKRYGSWRSGEAEREWSALELLSEHAPDLAPKPLEATLVGERPAVTMSRLGGVPLAAPLDAGRIAALAEAIITLQESIPRKALMELPRRAGHPAEFLEHVRAWCATRPGPDPDPLVRQAFVSAVDWLARVRLDDLVGAERPVFGTGDGNLSNYLWDGSRVRVIDFEHSGRSDHAFELAEVTEHISVGAARDDIRFAVLERVELPAAEERRFQNCRILHACYWLLSVLGDDPRHPRNPPGTLERQAARLLALLN
jgi:hypothetical protein